MKKILLILSVALISMTGMAQKFGHIDSQELLQLMPETKVAQAEIEKLTKDNEVILQNLQADYQKLVAEIQQNQATMAEAVLQSKYQQAQGLEQNIYDFQQTAQTEISKKNDELITPIIDKAKKAIEEVGKENGFTYIFDTSSGVIVYEGGENVLPLVKAKLGIPADATIEK